MNSPLQILVVLRLSLASLSQRVGSSTVIVIGIACVVGVLLSMLSVTAGLTRTLESDANPTHAIVYPADAQNEYGNGLSRESVGIILDAPGIARRSDGKPLGSAEVLQWLPPAEGFAEGSLYARGIGTAGIALRPGFKIVSGRMFRAGTHELLVGVGAESVFGLKVGDNVIMPDGEWPIVGAFSARGGLLESQLVGDVDTITAVARSSGFGGVLVALTSADVFEEFKRSLTTNPALSVTVERQSTYLLRTGKGYTRFFTAMAYLVSCIMATGALFGSMQIMYSAVDARAGEIAILRALGYGALPLALSVLFETVLLSLIGALLGTSIAWLLFNEVQTLSGVGVFNLYVSWRLVAFGFAIATILAVLGGLLPALRAARLSVVDALRAV